MEPPEAEPFLEGLKSGEVIETVDFEALSGLHQCHPAVQGQRTLSGLGEDHRLQRFPCISPAHREVNREAGGVGHVSDEMGTKVNGEQARGEVSEAVFLQRRFLEGKEAPGLSNRAIDQGFAQGVADALERFGELQRHTQAWQTEGQQRTPQGLAFVADAHGDVALCR
jgi:hypothetical protein